MGSRVSLGCRKKLHHPRVGEGTWVQVQKQACRFMCTYVTWGKGRSESPESALETEIHLVFYLEPEGWTNTGQA